MSSETDHPRQRTVAELLAQHGDVNATGRRRRRRAADGSDESGAAPVGLGAPAAPDWQASQRDPDRAVQREQAPPGQRETGGRRRADREPDPWESEPRTWEPQQPEPAWDQRRPADPQPWDSGPQGWDSGQQPWESSEWDARPQEDRWDAPEPAPTRSSRHREPEQWESGPQAWNGRPAEPEPRFPAVEPRGWDAQPPEPQPRGAAGSVPERPTEHIPRIHDENPSADVGLTARLQPHRRANGYQGDGYEADGYEADDYDHDEYERNGYDHDEDGPPTMVGAAPVGAEEWHRERTRGRRGGAPADDDGGPPTEAAAPLDFDDHPAGLGGRGFDDSFSDGFDDFYGGAQDQPPPPVSDVRSGNRRGRGARDEAEDDGYPAGEPDADDEERPSRARRFTSAVTDSAGQAWAAVIAQWIAGAVGGAALWVGFRFLWRSLPVVALAAAVLVTVGLVVVVRALLRNDDMRTTMFAVLVGLLLTASPAILVLMGR